MTADAWEPVDFLAEFRERETCLREVTELLKEKAQSETGKLWAHHLPLIVDALGQKMWQRTDGAILWLRSKLIVRLELPAAREYEAKLKAEKEQKARESVPHF